MKIGAFVRIQSHSAKVTLEINIPFFLSWECELGSSLRPSFYKQTGGNGRLHRDEGRCGFK
jgi:hypothetical protein